MHGIPSFIFLAVFKHRKIQNPEKSKFLVFLADIWLVRIMLLHSLIIAHPRKWNLQFHMQNFLENRSNNFFHSFNYVLSVNKCHLNIKLRELWLPVSPQVLIPEASGELVIFIIACHHQQLFEQLWRLGKSIKLASMHSARHKVVARAFRRALVQNRRINRQEALFIHCRMYCLVNFVP